MCLCMLHVHIGMPAYMRTCMNVHVHVRFGAPLLAARPSLIVGCRLAYAAPYVFQGAYACDGKHSVVEP